MLAHGFANAAVLRRQRDDRDRLREVRVRRRSWKQLQVVLADVVLQPSGLQPGALACAGAEELWLIEIAERDGCAARASDEQVGGVRTDTALDPVERFP